jgi:hypothetical protein
MNIGWPEGIVLGLIALNLLIAAALDGTPKDSKHSLSGKMLDSAILFGLLYWGGFFA